MNLSRRTTWNIHAAGALLWAACGGGAFAAPPLIVFVESAADQPSPAATAPGHSASSPTVALALVNLPKSVEPSIDEEPNGEQLADGVWVHRDTRGRTLARGAYLRGERQGLWIRYFDGSEAATFESEFFRPFQAPFTSEVEFQKGRIIGTCTFYDANRRMISQWPLQSGVAHGEVIWYQPDGGMRRQAAFRHGLMHGEQTEWDGKGDIIAKTQYVDGLLLTPHEERYSVTAVRCTGGQVDTSKRFEASFSWWQGIAGINAMEGEPGQAKHGQWTWRYESGQERLQGTYHEGRPMGTFTWWHENGQQQLTGSYVEGIPHGEFIWWHPNGQKQLSVSYVEGSQSGHWTHWNPAGLVVERNDATTDPLASFFEHGQPIAAAAGLSNASSIRR